MLRPRHARTLAGDSARRPQVGVGVLLSGMSIAAHIAAGSSADAYDGFLVNLKDAELPEVLRLGFDRHASVMLAGVAALTVPLVALVAAASRAAVRWRRGRDPAGPRHDGVTYRSAWIEVPGLHTSVVVVDEILRIGDGDDCDLAITGASARGTCALIQRTSDYDFILFDVSAGTAHLTVNDDRSDRRRLNNGDRIQIGNACLVFRTGERTPLSAGEAEGARVYQ